MNLLQLNIYFHEISKNLNHLVRWYLPCKFDLNLNYIVYLIELDVYTP